MIQLVTINQLNQPSCNCYLKRDKKSTHFCSPHCASFLRVHARRVQVGEEYLNITIIKKGDEDK